MKSLYESDDHQKILAQRRLDQDDARDFLNDKTSHVQDSTGDWAIRVLTNDLTAGERKDRRIRAGVVKKVQKFIPVETVKEEPQKNDRSPFTIEAVKEWLGQLGHGDINVRPEQSKAGLEFLASVGGCALIHNRTAGGSYVEEIPGESAEAAMRNYFTAAVNAAYIEGPKGERYIWHNRDLQFMKKEEEVYTHQPSKIKRKLMLTRRKARKVKGK